MTDYRKIIRLDHQRVSSRNIAESCVCSRNTAATILGKAREHGISWSEAEGTSNGDLHEFFFLGVSGAVFAYRAELRAHSEAARSGVTLTLLWRGCREERRRNDDTLLMCRRCDDDENGTGAPCSRGATSSPESRFNPVGTPAPPT